jgi:hypothetical protein
MPRTLAFLFSFVGGLSIVAVAGKALADYVEWEQLIATHHAVHYYGPPEGLIDLWIACGVAVLAGSLIVFLAPQFRPLGAGAILFGSAGYLPFAVAWAATAFGSANLIANSFRAAVAALPAIAGLLAAAFALVSDHSAFAR